MSSLNKSYPTFLFYSYLVNSLSSNLNYSIIFSNFCFCYSSFTLFINSSYSLIVFMKYSFKFTSLLLGFPCSTVHLPGSYPNFFICLVYSPFKSMTTTFFSSTNCIRAYLNVEYSKVVSSFSSIYVSSSKNTFLSD